MGFQREGTFAGHHDLVSAIEATEPKMLTFFDNVVLFVRRRKEANML